jgi:RNA polymerase sigma-70 factor (ECF subfamily)
MAEPSGARMTHTEVFQQHRPRLFAIAYRMLGSAAEADDVLQEAFLRFQSAALDEIESVQGYLATIVTRLCLNELTSARARRETYVGPWLPEPVLTPIAEAADPEASVVKYESISLAFLKLLENLTPAERAVFILREVFDYAYDEVARMLDKSEPACRKLFSRAKGYLAANRPRFTADPEEHQRLLYEFMQAAGGGDLEGLSALLAEDAIFWGDGGGKVRGAALQPVHGRDAVARFVLGVTSRFLPPGALVDVADINGKPSILIRHADATPAIVISLEVEGGQVRNIWAVANPDKLGNLV